MKKYERAAQYILEKVSPSLAIGDKLPPEAKLAADAGVSLMTLRRAIEELRLQGILSRVPGHRAVLRSRGDCELLQKARKILIVRLSMDFYYAELLLAIQREMIESGNFEMIVLEPREKPGVPIENTLCDMIPSAVVENHAEAVLLLPGNCNPERIEQRLRKLGVPLIGVLGNGLFRNSINIDFASGTYHGLRYLYEKGRDNLVYIGLTSRERHMERGVGVWRFFEEYYPGESPEKRMFNAYGYYDEGYHIFNEVLDRGLCPNGILAHNDLCASGIIMAATARHIEIPRQLSIIGFDNLASSQTMVPRLTSMAVSEREIARKVLESLNFIFQRGAEITAVRVIMQPQIYCRDSA
mgnify:CR=1 FL=1|jgi:DNA-binding LacI/PurR family transcriptional regulator